MLQMKWTKRLPTDSGWYWFRAKDVAPTIAQVRYSEGGRFLVNLHELLIIDAPGNLRFEEMEWSDEPLKPPE